jgi:hypothetical protein
MDSERVYLSYLLRMWQSENGGNRVWLASLESPLTGERRGFSNLQALFDYLCVQTGVNPPNLCELKGDKNEPAR